MSGLVSADLNKYGPFGKYNGVNIVTNRTTDFSSGSVGASAFMVSGSTFNGHVGLARGGKMMTKGLTVGVIYDIGIASATSAANTEHILVLRR